MYSEQEAKRRICPQLSGSPLTATRKANCAGSQCMAWRWSHEWTTVYDYDDTRKAELEALGYVAVGARGGQIPTLVMSKKTECGFCGLAGEQKLHGA